MYGFRTEPILITAFVGALMITLVEFGIDISPAKQTAIQALIAAVMALFARSQVFSQATVLDAGVTPADVEKAADKSNSVQLAVKTGTQLALVLALLLPAVACAPRSNVTKTPDQAVAQAATYGTQALSFVTDAQKIVNDFAVSQGGRTPATDKFSAAVRDRVIPAAEDVRDALNAYAIATTVAAQLAAKNELETYVDVYERLVQDVFKLDALPPGLSSNLVTTANNIRTLVTNIRNAFLASTRGAGNFTVPPSGGLQLTGQN